MSNLVKQVYVVNNGDDRWIINSNAHADQLINGTKNPDHVFREMDFREGSLEGYGEEFQETEEVELPSPEELVEEARQQVEAMLTEANEQVEALLADAKTQASQAFEDAKNQGHMEGQLVAEQEKQAMLESLQAEYAAKEEALMQQFLAKEEMLEAELVDTLVPVMEKVLMVEFAADRDILLHLCHRSLEKQETEKVFHIKTSPENREYFMEHKEELLHNIPSEVTVEFLSDSTMTDNSCVIETESGIIDCGADTQMKNLIKAIQKLSRD